MTTQRLTTGAAVLIALWLSGPGAAAVPAQTDPAKDPHAASWRRGEAYTHLMRSLFKVRRGDVAAAVAEIHSAVELVPDSPDLLVQSAQLLLQWTGRLGESEQLARRALELDDQHTGALRFLAQMAAARALGQEADPASRDEAIRLFEKLVADEDDADPEALRTLAQLRLSGRDLDGAIRATRRVVELRPGDLRATQTLAQLLLRSGRGAEALEALLQYATDHPQQEEVIGWAEQLAGSQQAWDTAVSVLSARAPFSAEQWPIQQVYGRALLRVGRMDEAVATLEAALNVRPSDMRLRKDLALAYRGVGRLADARLLLEALAREAPEYPFLQQLLAETLDLQRNVVGALEAYGEALNALAEREDVAASHRDAIRHRIALLHLGQENLDAARATLGRLELPDGGLALEIRTRVEIEAGRLSDARELARRLEVADRPGVAALLQGEIFVADKRWNKAAAKFADALERLGPGSRVSIAEIYREAGRPEEGLRLLRGWVADEPEFADARFHLGVYYYELDRLDDAEIELREAFRLDPRHARALNFLGYSLAERKTRLDDALEMIERALEVESWNGAYLDSLGWVYYQMGRYDDAREPLERAARELPKDPTVLEHLGDLYLALGQRADALAAWDQALEEGAEDPSALRVKIARERDAAESAGEGRPLEGRLELIAPPR